MIKKIVYIILSCLLVAPINTIAQTEYSSEEELIKAAGKVFEQKEYFQSMELYSQLLSNHTDESSYLYRFAVSSLFASSDKKEALDFLIKASQKGGVSKRVWFYLGRAYHLNYEFDKAIANYKKFNEVASTSDKEGLDVSRQIEMCKNGIRIVNGKKVNISVFDIRDMPKDNFYAAYDASLMGGQVLAKLDQFKSDADKKKGDNSPIFLPNESQSIFYSSIGKGSTGGRDLYRAKRLPTGEWMEGENLGTTLNTPYDEDYPYFHPYKNVLYFSSKGHSSIGGYDIFKSKYNPTNNSWSVPVNIGFALNSTYDDIYYVPSLEDEYAFFASEREAEYGKVNVFQVKAIGGPADFIVIKGSMIDKTDVGNKQGTINIFDTKTNQLVGKYNTNKINGNYLLTLLPETNYKLVASSYGYKDYEETFYLPTVDNNKPLEQQIIFSKINDIEKVGLVNYFDSKLPEELAMAVEKEGEESKPVVKNYNALASLTVNTTKPKVFKEKPKPKPVKKVFDETELIKLVNDQTLLNDKMVDAINIKVMAANRIANQKKSDFGNKKTEQKKLKDQLETTTSDSEKSFINSKIINIDQEVKQLEIESEAASSIQTTLVNEQKRIKTQKEQLNLSLQSYNSAKVTGDFEDEKEMLQTQYEGNKKSTGDFDPDKIIDKALEQSKANYESQKANKQQLYENASTYAQEAQGLMDEAKLLEQQKDDSKGKDIKAELQIQADELRVEAKVKEEQSNQAKFKAQELEKGLANAEKQLAAARVIGKDIDKVSAVVAINDNLASEATNATENSSNLEENDNSELSGVKTEPLPNDNLDTDFTFEEEDTKESSLEIGTEEEFIVKEQVRILETDLTNIKKDAELTIDPEEKEQLLLKAATLENEIEKIKSGTSDLNEVAANNSETSDGEELTFSEEVEEEPTYNEELTFSEEFEAEPTDNAELTFSEEVVTEPTYKEELDLDDLIANTQNKQEQTTTVVNVDNYKNPAAKEKALLANELATKSDLLKEEAATLKSDIETVSDPVIKASMQEKLVTLENDAKQLADNSTQIVAQANSIENKENTGDTEEVAFSDATDELTFESESSEIDNDSETDFNFTDDTPKSVTAGTDPFESTEVNLANYNNQEAKQKAVLAKDLATQSKVLKMEAKILENEIASTENNDEKEKLESNLQKMQQDIKELDDNTNIILAEANSIETSSDGTISSDEQLAFNDTETSEEFVFEEELGADNELTFDTVSNIEPELTFDTESNSDNNQLNTTPNNELNFNEESFETGGSDSEFELSFEEETNSDDSNKQPLNTIQKIDFANIKTVDDIKQYSDNYKSESAKGEFENAVALMYESDEYKQEANQLKASMETITDPDVNEEMQYKVGSLEKISDEKRKEAEFSFIRANSIEQSKETSSEEIAFNNEFDSNPESSENLGYDGTFGNISDDSDLSTNDFELEEGSSTTNDINEQLSNNNNTVNRPVPRKAIQFDEVALTTEEIAEIKESPEFIEYETIKEEEASQEELINQLVFDIKDAKEQTTTLRADIETIEDEELKNQYLERISGLESSADSRKQKIEVFKQDLETKRAKTDTYLASISGDMKNKILTISGGVSIDYVDDSENTGDISASNNINKEEIDYSSSNNFDNPNEAAYNSSNNTDNNSIAEIKLTTTEQAFYSDNNPIPVDAPLPSGIIFKVQIGAFSKPIPQDLFKGIQPLRGELTNFGVTRYTAGEFRAYGRADAAKQQVRNMGYSDAFVVAFYNGKRISNAEAVAIIQSGDGGSSETRNTFAQNNNSNSGANNTNQNNTSNSNTTNTNNLDIINTNVSTPNRGSTANQGGSSSNLTTVELYTSGQKSNPTTGESLRKTKGILYTVQVGVFSKQVNSASLYNLSPLFFDQTSGGLYKYTTGIYDNKAAASTAKDRIVALGIQDAFVVVYYNGSKIDFQNATKLERANRGAVLAESSPISNKTFEESESENLPITGTIEFKVQIGAYQSEVPTEVANNFFTVINKGLEFKKNEQGVTIYTLGSFTNNTDAQSLKEQIYNTFEDAFVVAYANDKKVPLSKAIAASENR